MHLSEPISSPSVRPERGSRSEPQSKGPRPSALLLAMLCVACSSAEPSPYSGDELAAIEAECLQRVASTTSCDSACTLAGLNASCPESDPIWGSPEMGAYLDCVDLCPVVRTCSDGKRFFDCDCRRTCAAMGPARFQGLLAFNADCQRVLPECQ